MQENMTNSEQTKWVLKETGRMIAIPFVWYFDLNVQFWHSFNNMELVQAFRRPIESIRKNREIRNKLEDLEDPTLLERLLAAPIVVHIPVQANDEPQQIPVRFKIRNALSIDGIIAR